MAQTWWLRKWMIEWIWMGWNSTSTTTTYTLVVISTRRQCKNGKWPSKCCFLAQMSLDLITIIFYFSFFFHSRLLPGTRSPVVGPAPLGYRYRRSNTWHDALLCSSRASSDQEPVVRGVKVKSSWGERLRADAERHYWNWRRSDPGAADI